jgi:hypothetical protein
VDDQLHFFESQIRRREIDKTSNHESTHSFDFIKHVETYKLTMFAIGSSANNYVIQDRFGIHAESIGDSPDSLGTKCAFGIDISSLQYKKTNPDPEHCYILSTRYNFKTSSSRRFWF